MGVGVVAPAAGRGGNELERVSVMAPLLARWARRRHGPHARLTDVERLPGHSGITFGFGVAVGDAEAQRLVVKVPPLGVRQRGSTDVLRQVPVLRLMAGEGVRVPTVRSWGPAEAGGFPVPHLIVDRVAGDTLGDVFTGPLRTPRPLTLRCFDRAVEELVRVHGAPWRALRSWTRPRGPREEVDHWVPVLRKGQEESWVRQGMRLRERLLRTAPRRASTGVVHGDYYSNNLLFEGAELSAVLDWEGSTVGPRMLDVGWLCMVYDGESWGPTRRSWMAGSPDPDWLLERYEAHRGRPVEHPEWYRALAGYRLACLTSYYVRLHRTGRRVDPVWEVFAESVPWMLARSGRLLDP